MTSCLMEGGKAAWQDGSLPSPALRSRRDAVQCDSDLRQPRVTATKPPFRSGPSTTPKILDLSLDLACPGSAGHFLPDFPLTLLSTSELMEVGASQGTDPDFFTNWTISGFCSCEWTLTIHPTKKQQHPHCRPALPSCISRTSLCSSSMLFPSGITQRSEVNL